MESSYDKSKDTDKLKSKLEKNPSFALGLVALAGIAGYGAYSISRSKGKRLSLQLIKLRLAAQGTFVGCLTLGIIYSICRKHLGFFQSEKKN